MAAFSFLTLFPFLQHRTQLVLQSIIIKHKSIKTKGIIKKSKNFLSMLSSIMIIIITGIRRIILSAAGITNSQSHVRAVS